MADGTVWRTNRSALECLWGEEKYFDAFEKRHVKMSTFLLNKTEVFCIIFLYFLFLFLEGKSHQKELLFVILLYIKNSSCICNFNTLSNCIVYWAGHFVQSKVNPFWFCPIPFNVKTGKAVPAQRSLLQTALSYAACHISHGILMLLQSVLL